MDFWKEHSEADNLLDFQDIEMGGAKIGFFYSTHSCLYVKPFKIIYYLDIF
jgi:hypothetical protein